MVILNILVHCTMYQNFTVEKALHYTVKMSACFKTPKLTLTLLLKQQGANISPMMDI